MASSADPDNSTVLRWIRDHLDYPHADYCLIWPFGRRSGYGCLILDGAGIYAHRYICELKNGPPPTPQHVTAHSCDRGEDACVNPHHLSWKTGSENQLERKDGKGKRKRSKLTAEQAAEIRAVATLEPVEVTAERYGVSLSAIRQVQSGRTWSGGDRRRRFDLTAEQVLYVRRMKGVKTQTEIARELGIHHTVVWRIHNGKAYAFVADEAA